MEAQLASTRSQLADAVQANVALQTELASCKAELEILWMPAGDAGQARESAS
jgi:hypothetical protein